MSPYPVPRAILLTLVLLLAFQGVGFAGPHDVEISKFMRYCLLENESFSKERLGLTNNYLLSIGKFEVGFGSTYTVQDSILINVNESNSSDIKISNSSVAIQGLLSDKYTAMNITFDSLYPTSFEMGEILAMVMRFNDSREPNEGKCKLWIGTDTPEFDCNDRESCFRACHTPLSNPVAGGVGWPFVDAVWAFMNDTRAINSNLSFVLRDIEDIEAKSENTEELLIDLEQSLTGMQNASVSISQSGLFDPWRYSFCYPIRYNRTSIITAKILTNRIKDRMQVLFLLPKQAKSIAESGTKRADICRINKEKAEKPKTHVSFWGKLSREERNFLRLLSIETSPGPIFPMMAKSRSMEWE